MYIDGRLHRRIAMLVRASGCGSISGFIIRLLGFIWRSTGRISPGCSVRSTGPGMTRMGQTYADLLQYRPIFEERRWGEYKVVNTAEFSNGYKSITKQLKIKSDKSISYQLHRHRNEVWTFIDGEGVLVLDDIRSVVSRGDTVTIKKGVKHTVRAISDLTFIEVQSGELLVESDVERFEWIWNDR